MTTILVVLGGGFGGVTTTRELERLFRAHPDGVRQEMRVDV